MPTVKRITIESGRPLELPTEVVEALGQVVEATLVVDAEKRTVMLTAMDPDIVENQAILDEMAKLNEGMSVEEYGAPVPPSFLNRRGKGHLKEDE